MATDEDILARLDLIAHLLGRLVLAVESRNPPETIIQEGTPAAIRQRRYRLNKQAKEFTAKKPSQQPLFATPAIPEAPKGVKQSDLVFEEAWKMWPPQPNGVKPNKAKARERFKLHVKPSEYPKFIRAVRFYTISDQVQRGFQAHMCNWILDWRAWTNDTPPEEPTKKELVL